MAIKINVQFGSDVLSESINIQSDMVLGENCVISGFKVSSYTGNSINISPGVACVQGARIEETSDTKTLTIPDLSQIMWYAVLKYEHRTSTVSFFFKNSATLASNEVILTKVKVVNGSIGLITNADSTKMICELNRSTSSLQVQIDNLEEKKCDKGHTVSFDLITNKPQYYPVDINMLKQIFEIKGVSKGVTCGIDLNAPSYYPNAWHDLKIFRIYDEIGCRFNWNDGSVTLDDAGIYITEINFTYICEAADKTDSGFDFQILENGSVQDKFRQYYNVNNHANGTSFIYGGMNTLPNPNTNIRPQIKPIFDPGRMSTHFTGFWSIRKLCDIGPEGKSSKPMLKLLEELSINQRGDMVGLTLDKVFPNFKIDVDYQVQYINDKVCKLRVYNSELVKLLEKTPIDTLAKKVSKLYPKMIEQQQQKNRLSEEDLLEILKNNKDTLKKILSDV